MKDIINNETDSDDLLTNKNVLIKENFNEEDLYEEPEHYQDYDKMEINSKNDSINNNNIIKNNGESKDNFISRKDENLNINSIIDENTNNFQLSESNIGSISEHINNESCNEKDKNIMSESYDFKEKYSETYTESENNSRSNININKKEEEIDVEINPELLEKLKKAFPLISSEDDFKRIYKKLKDKNYFELTIFEIMNIIQREISIKITENNYNNKKYINEFNNYLYKFPIEYMDIIDHIYINNEHLQIMELYKTMSIDEKNKYYNAKELTEDFFYNKDKNDKRRKVIKYMDGRYNYLPVECKNIEKCDLNKCIYAHNKNEINYHPLFYKTKYKDDNNYGDSNMALCPTAKNFDTDFRIIYNYKDENIIYLMNVLFLECKNNNKRIKSFYKKNKKFDINTFKIFKCKNEKCEKNPHLCYKYHNISEKRRPPYLYRYTNEKCEEIKTNKKCKYGDFCNKCHTSNEFNYHKLYFGKYVLCCRDIKNGECVYIDTCYGYHDKNNENTIRKTILDKENTKFEKLKKEKNIDDFKCQKCKKITKSIIFYYLKCRHILCKKCFNKIKSDTICPLCEKSFNLGDEIMIDFKESSKNIDELLFNN